MSVELAEKLEDSEQFEKAYEEYQKVLEKRPKSLEILERLGHLASLLDKKDDAANYYSEILELDATNILAYEQLMDIYINTDKFKYYTMRGNMHIIQHQPGQAITDFKKALNKAQSEEEIAPTRFVLATLYEQTNKPNQAIEEYLRVIETENSNEIVYLKLAQLYEKQDSISSAIDILQRAINNNFETENIKEALANYYLKAGNPEKAREMTTNKLQTVKCLLDEENTEEAFEMLNSIKNDYKKNPKFHSLMAQYYFIKEDSKNALLSVDEFEKLDKNSPLVPQMRAMIFEMTGDNFKEHKYWAKYNLMRGNKDIALNEYMLALQYDDTNVEVLTLTATLLEEMNDKTHAAEFYERLSKAEPTNKKALEKLAEFRAGIGDYRESANYWEKLYALDEKNARVIKNLAKAYEKIKNRSKALELYKKYLDMSVVSDDIEEIRAKVNKMESSTNVYEDASQNDEGLIGWFVKLFSKKG